eukprot:scaffold22942_cov64-Phaeocystis_antarctica.AAC.11
MPSGSRASDRRPGGRGGQTADTRPTYSSKGTFTTSKNRRMSPLCWRVCERGEESRAELVPPPMRLEAAREAAVAASRVAEQHHPIAAAAAAAQELRRVLVDVARADDRVVVGVDDERRHLVRVTI